MHYVRDLSASPGDTSVSGALSRMFPPDVLVKAQADVPCNVPISVKVDVTHYWPAVYARIALYVIKCYKTVLNTIIVNNIIVNIIVYSSNKRHGYFFINYYYIVKLLEIYSI